MISASATADLGDTQHILALSGGGAWGAFGAGFLNGWSAHSRSGTAEPKRVQQFDVVTGISTGALLATYAFLGQSYDKGLIDQYHDKTDADIFKRRFFLTIPFSNSLNTTAPLRKAVLSMISDSVIREVAAQHHNNRRLIVGAVDLDSGDFTPFDLTLLATRFDSHPQQTRDCFIAALIASASTPLMFEPVFINNSMYTDGGVRQTVFVSKLVNRESVSGTRYDISVIMNTNMEIDPKLAPGKELGNGIIPIAGRLIPIATNQTDLDALDLIVADANLNKHMTARWTSAAGNPCQELYEKDTKNIQFKPKWMNCLIHYGEKDIWAVPDSPWRYDRARADN